MLHLAQANIARFKAPLDSALMKEFTDFLEPVNKLADESKGFVWRLTDKNGRSASYIESPFNDELMAINVSIWEDYGALTNFVYGTVHSYFVKNKKKWFDLNSPSQFIMWWIPVGELPTLSMVKEKLEYQEKLGDSPKAFSIKQMFDAQGNEIKKSTT
jgi:hypothetical protein